MNTASLDVDTARLEVNTAKLPKEEVKRSEVFELAADPNVTVATVCVAAMAWGGMHLGSWKLLCRSSRGEWLNVAQRIRGGKLTRAQAYERLKALREQGRLKGMGPAFFTKLIYFLTPRDNATPKPGYIMDQWAGSSVNLLTGSDMVLLNATRAWGAPKGKLDPSFEFTVSDENTSDDYEAFCSVVDRLACRFCLCVDQVDQALFSAGGRTPKTWRKYVTAHQPQLVGRAEHGPTNDEPEGARKPPTSIAPLGVEFMTFFAGAGVAGAFLTGFVYTNEYYHSFGLSLMEINIGYVDAAAIGTYLLRDPWMFIGALIVVTVASFSVALARRHFDDLGFYLSVALLFIVFCYVAMHIGGASADHYSAKVIYGSGGTRANCVLRSPAKFPKEFRKYFQEMTELGKVRKIIATDEAIYLSFVIPPSRESPPESVPESPPENRHGRSFEINKSDVLYCRFDGN